MESWGETRTQPVYKTLQLLTERFLLVVGNSGCLLISYYWEILLSTFCGAGDYSGCWRRNGKQLGCCSHEHWYIGNQTEGTI